MPIRSIIAAHHQFKEESLSNRFFKHHHIMELLNQLPSSFEVECLGLSVKGKTINLVKWGSGKIKIMLWSQMHGDEATGTMALFDLMKFLQTSDPLVDLLAENCQLLMIPMVNPDGATAFTRRNAQQIDINRDFLQELSPEAKILKKARNEINPDFGFNLHDQLTLWSVSGSLKPATLSYLAPAIDQELSINETRNNAMCVIAAIYKEMSHWLPQQIGLFDDEFEPRAFGDNFQRAGTATILIEAGGFENDFEKQRIRKYYFGSIISGLHAIVTKAYQQQSIADYFVIPSNNKQLFHILIHRLMLNGIEVSIGINYEECAATDGESTIKTYTIQDIGDLSFCDAYQTFDAKSAALDGTILLFQNANFTLHQDQRRILCFQNGKLI